MRRQSLFVYSLQRCPLLGFKHHRCTPKSLKVRNSLVYYILNKVAIIDKIRSWYGYEHVSDVNKPREWGSLIRDSRNVGKLSTCANSGYQALSSRSSMPGFKATIAQALSSTSVATKIMTTRYQLRYSKSQPGLQRLPGVRLPLVTKIRILKSRSFVHLCLKNNDNQWRQ